MSEQLNVLLEFYRDNDRMVETVERVNDSYLEMLDALEVLEAENAKLRELVRISIDYCNSGTCDECPIQGEDGSCPYADMARELGVDV